MCVMAYQFPVDVVTSDQEAQRSRCSFSPSSGWRCWWGHSSRPKLQGETAWPLAASGAPGCLLIITTTVSASVFTCLFPVSVLFCLFVYKVSLDLGSTLIQYDIMCGLNSVSPNTIFLALIKIKRNLIPIIMFPFLLLDRSIQARSRRSPLELIGRLCNTPAFSLHPKPHLSVHFLKMYLYQSTTDFKYCVSFCAQSLSHVRPFVTP